MARSAKAVRREARLLAKIRTMPSRVSAETFFGPLEEYEGDGPVGSSSFAEVEIGDLIPCHDLRRGRSGRFLAEARG